MRIVGGSLRGLKLAGFDAKGIRPTTDRVREALFNVLAHDSDLRTDAGPCPAGCAVLDVFAGTGALGLEALSRGARHVSFIENDPAAQGLLRQNLTKAKVGEIGRLVGTDALKPDRSRGDPADLVLMDPPYGEGLAGPVLTALRSGGWIAPDALVVVETDRRDALEVPPGFEVLRHRDYGRTRLSFIQQV